MSKYTALEVMRTALQQYHYTEYPPGSNKTKYGKEYGWNGQFWCAQYVWWVGWVTAGKNNALNPFVKSANAGDIQDLTVKTKGGKYILRKTSDNEKKKKALPDYQFGDIVSFNFNGGSNRDHTGLVVGVWGDYIYCIEGNTSFDDGGSQSNGGAVALRKRSYKTGVCVVRPDYKPFKFHEPTTPYLGEDVALPDRRGCFKYGDKSEKVKNLQTALAWANGYKLEPNKDFGSKTFAEVVIFQVAHGLEPDGIFGQKCLDKLNALIKKNAPKKNVFADAAAKTKKASYNSKLSKTALDCAWPEKTKEKVWSAKTGKPRPAYKKLLDKIFPKHKKWKKQIRKGASCAVYIATVVRATVDKSFPCNDPVKQAAYMKKSKKWKKVKWSEVKKGDLIITKKKKKSVGHIMMYVDKDHIAEAVYNKAYPHIKKMPKSMKTAKAIRKNFVSLQIFRRV